jgi:hypothetical protein
MSLSDHPKSSEPKSEEQIETKLEVSPGRQNSWLKEVRFFVAVAIASAAIIEYKSKLYNQGIVIDIAFFGSIISFVAAPIAGISIYQTIGKFIETVLSSPR